MRRHLESFTLADMARRASGGNPADRALAGT
jgi:hypothetical protein